MWNCLWFDFSISPFSHGLSSESPQKPTRYRDFLSTEPQDKPKQLVGETEDAARKERHSQKPQLISGQYGSGQYGSGQASSLQQDQRQQASRQLTSRQQSQRQLTSRQPTSRQLSQRQLTSRQRISLPRNSRGKGLRQSRVKQFLAESRLSQLSNSHSEQPKSFLSHRDTNDDSILEGSRGSTGSNASDRNGAGFEGSNERNGASFDGVLNDAPHTSASSVNYDVRLRENIANRRAKSDGIILAQASLSSSSTSSSSNSSSSSSSSSSNVSRRCSSSCRRCKEEDAVFCLECRNPYHFLSADGSCDYNCPLASTYKNFLNQTCDSCHRWGEARETEVTGGLMRWQGDQRGDLGIK